MIAARAAGAAQIIVTDLARSSSASSTSPASSGADATIVADAEDVVARVDDLTGGRGVDVVVDVTPMATQPVLDAVAVVRNGGTIVLSGVKGGPTVALDPDVLVRKSMTLRGVFTVDSPAYRQAIRTARKRRAAVCERCTPRSIRSSAPRRRSCTWPAARDGPPAINVAIAPPA